MLSEDPHHAGIPGNDLDVVDGVETRPDLAQQPVTSIARHPETDTSDPKDMLLTDRSAETDASDPKDMLLTDRSAPVCEGSDKTETVLTLSEELELVAHATQMRARRMAERKEPPFDKITAMKTPTRNLAMSYM